MKQAETVVSARAEIAKLAAQFGATPSPVLRQRFEEALSNLDDATPMATAELASAREIAKADARLGAGRGLLERIGLWSASPEVKLEQAKQQFSKDSFATANANVLALHDELDGARSRGLYRIVIVFIPLVLLWAAVTTVRRRRQRAREGEERRERAALITTARSGHR